MFFVSCVSHAFASVYCCLVSTCWERADLLALVGDVYCIFVTFPCGILCQVWYLIVSFPDLCQLSYLHGQANSVRNAKKHALFVTSQNDVISIIRKLKSETSSQKIDSSADIIFGSLTY